MSESEISRALPMIEADLHELLAEAARYPRSYGRERLMSEADAIIDRALDQASVRNAELVEA